MNLKIFYPIINGEITGGNMIALRIIEESLRRGYAVVANSPTEGKFTDTLRKKGVKIYHINTRHSFRFDTAIRLARVIKKENINLVHSHVPLGGAILSRLSGWIAGVPVITHAHLPDTMNRNLFVKQIQFLLNWITSRFFCAKVIAVSESVKRKIIKQGVAANKITIIYNGINLDNGRYKKGPIEIRNEFGLRQNQQIIGEVGRLCKAKGQHTLLKAAQKVIKSNPDIVFMIVGEDLEGKGEYEKKLKKLADNLGLKKEIIFTGYRSDIAELMIALDFFVLPSLIEGLPVVILEAMAAKKAVITTSVDGNSEVVVNGKTGIIIPPEDPDRLAQAILYYLENPKVSKEMGERGYERAERHFSLPQMVNRVMEIYKEVIAQRQWQI